MFFLVSTHNLITTNFKLHLLSTRIHAYIFRINCGHVRYPDLSKTTRDQKPIIIDQSSRLHPACYERAKKIPISQKLIDPKLYVIFTLSFSSNLNELTSKESKLNASLSLEIYSTRIQSEFDRGVCEIYFDQQV